MISVYRSERVRHADEIIAFRETIEGVIKMALKVDLLSPKVIAQVLMDLSKKMEKDGKDE